ncbi:hypothetical protein A9P79_01250 [Cupriavidus taiwanensis]|nr:hypothetical protein A9P79_01250 [Cupriavidus taiwanensis]
MARRHETQSALYQPLQMLSRIATRRINEQGIFHIEIVRVSECPLPANGKVIVFAEFVRRTLCS